MTFKVKYTYLAITYGRPFVSKLWHDIRAVFSHVYLQSFLLHDIRAFFCHVYLRSFLLCGVFIPKYMTIFLQTRIYVRTKKPIYMRLYYVLYILLCVFEKSLSLFRFIQVSKSCKMNIMYLGKFEFSHFGGWEGQAQANSSSLVEELRWSYFNLIWLWFNNRASPS